jgi:TolA-binding protein
VEAFLYPPVSATFRKLGWLLAVLVGGTYAVFALRGPQGLPALIGKWEEVRSLEQEHQQIQEQIRQKRDRLRRLKEREDEMENELRRDLQQLKPGEKMMVLPESESKATAEPEPGRK